MSDLFKIYETIQEQIKNEDETKKEIEEQEELRTILSSIIEGKKEYYTNNKGLLEKIGIKYKKRENGTITWKIGWKGYYFKFNKTNLNKIEQYLRKEDYYDSNGVFKSIIFTRYMLIYRSNSGINNRNI